MKLIVGLQYDKEKQLTIHNIFYIFLNKRFSKSLRNIASNIFVDSKTLGFALGFKIHQDTLARFMAYTVLIIHGISL